MGMDSCDFGDSFLLFAGEMLSVFLQDFFSETLLPLCRRSPCLSFSRGVFLGELRGENFWIDAADRGGIKSICFSHKVRVPRKLSDSSPLLTLVFLLIGGL